MYTYERAYNGELDLTAVLEVFKDVPTAFVEAVRVPDREAFIKNFIKRTLHDELEAVMVIYSHDDPKQPRKILGIIYTDGRIASMCLKAVWTVGATYKIGHLHQADLEEWGELVDKLIKVK